MKFEPLRALVFGAIGLPVGFILVAFGFAVTGREIEAPAIFPWAIGIALIVALIGGFTASRDDDVA